MYNYTQGTELDIKFIWVHITRLDAMLRALEHR
jgi:hypothetical protein